MVRCAAPGCRKVLARNKTGPPRKWCSERCRKRESYRYHHSRLCKARGCKKRVTNRKHGGLRRVYCSPTCRKVEWMRRHRAKLRDEEPPLSPYWRQYLERFDRALKERTPDAWAACHEMAPVSTGRPKYYHRDLAAALQSLEA